MGGGGWSSDLAAGVGWWSRVGRAWVLEPVRTVRACDWGKYEVEVVVEVVRCSEAKKFVAGRVTFGVRGGAVGKEKCMQGEFSQGKLEKASGIIYCSRAQLKCHRCRLDLYFACFLHGDAVSW